MFDTIPRIRFGTDANGINRHADINGNMVPLGDPQYYEKTQFLLESLDID